MVAFIYFFGLDLRDWYPDEDPDRAIGGDGRSIRQRTRGGGMTS
jgi:hypothetical protein